MCPYSCSVVLRPRRDRKEAGREDRSLSVAALIVVLLGVGPASAQPVPQDWTRQLQSADERVRLAAVVLVSEEAQALRVRGNPEAERALRELGAALAQRVRKDSDAGVRQTAALALAHVRAPGSVAGPAWADALRDPETNVRRAAAEAIGLHSSRTLDERRRTTRLAQRLPVLAQTAGDAVAFIAPAAQAIRDQEPAVQLAGLHSLAGLFQNLADLPRVDPRDLDDLTQSFIQNLTSQATFLALHQALADLAGEVQKRKLAALLAEVIGRSPLPSAAAAGQALEELGRWRVRMTQSDLRTGGTETASLLLAVLRNTLPALRSPLKTAAAPTRLHVLHALETLGPDGRVLQTEVRGNLTFSDRFVRWAAARTLGKMGPTDDEKVIVGLARLVATDDLDVAAAAADALAVSGAKAKAAVPDLAIAVETRDPVLQFQAIQALAAIGEAKGAVPALAKALRGPDLRVRQAAARLLRQLGVDAAPALPALREAAHDSDPEVRQVAAEAVLKILAPK